MRYRTIPRFLFQTDADPDQWEVKAPAALSVDEEQPQAIGVTDQYGNMIYRIPTAIGFHTEE